MLKRVADSYVPPNPPSVDIRPSKVHDEAVDVHDEAAEVLDEASAGAVADRMEVVPAIPSSLVKPPFDACIPHIVELLMEDLFGEIAAAKEVRVFFFCFFFLLFFFFSVDHGKYIISNKGAGAGEKWRAFV